VVSLRVHVGDPVPKWTAQPPVTVWRVAEPQGKWLTQPPSSDDTSEGVAFVPFELSSLATPYVRVPVYADQLGIVVNPTSFVVEMAFINGAANPASGDWKAASWTTTAQGQYVAQCLVGPNGGTITLSAGLTYTVWIQIQAPPETVIINTGQIQVT